MHDDYYYLIQTSYGTWYYLCYCLTNRIVLIEVVDFCLD
jgi:hypothetical protein